MDCCQLLPQLPQGIQCVLHFKPYRRSLIAERPQNAINRGQHAVRTFFDRQLQLYCSSQRAKCEMYNALARAENRGRIRNCAAMLFFSYWRQHYWRILPKDGRVAHGTHLLDSPRIRVDRAQTMEQMVYDHLLSVTLSHCWAAADLTRVVDLICYLREYSLPRQSLWSIKDRFVAWYVLTFYSRQQAR